MASLEYSHAALKETLRLYSVVPVVTRVAEEDDDLGGTRVPAGTIVIMSLQGGASGSLGGLFRVCLGVASPGKQASRVG